MKKLRQIILGIASILYLILFFMKIDIPRNIFITLAGIVLISQAIDEWYRYKETKKKIYLLIPISLLVIIIFLVPSLFF